MEMVRAKTLIAVKDLDERIKVQKSLEKYDTEVVAHSHQIMYELRNNPEIVLVVLDAELEGMKDYLLIKDLKTNGLMKNLHIILITEQNDIEKEIRGMDNGAVAFIRRPINYHLLTVMIQRQLILASLRNILDVGTENDAIGDEVNMNDRIIKFGKDLLERERLFRTLFEQANLGITIGHNGNYMAENLAGSPTINKKFQEIVGRGYEELLELGWENITHPDDVEKDQVMFQKLWSGEIDHFQMEKRYVKPDGSSVWVDMKICRLVLSNIEGFNYITFVEDISKRKMYEEGLKNSEDSMAVLLSNLPGMAYRCNFDKDWTMEFVSEGCKDLTGYSSKELVGNNKIAFGDIVAPKYRQELRERLKVMIAQKKQYTEEYEIISKDGKRKWVFEKGQAICNEDDQVVALEGLIIDITERKTNENKLRFINEHDSLTGLHNRRYFSTYIQKMRNLESSVVLLVNIKNFSLLNLTYGYGFAEDLILNVGTGLGEIKNTNIKVFHISIDRFIILVENAKDRTALEKLSWRIISIIDESISINTVHGYLGILELREVGRDVDRILKYSSIAAKEASERQNGRFRFFNKEMERKILRRERIQENLTEYLAGNIFGGLFMEYQPIIDARTLDVHGFEALARFNSPQLGLVSPIEFIEIAENNKLIVPLGREIIRQTFAFLKSLERKGFNDVIISINISIIQLLRDNFVNDLIEIADKIGISLNKVNLELTESTFSSNFTEINTKLSRLKQLGIETAIDDFGTGYSSLSRERELDISCLKIDKSFIDKLDSTNEGDSITSDIISLAHKLGHVVVAEGVETENQMNYLIKNKCDYFQGYYFSKPLSWENSIEFIRKLRNNGM